MKIREYKINPALIVIDVQNGFVSKGGSYDLLKMDTSNYRAVIPVIKELIEISRAAGIPVFYTQAVRESSGIDLLTKTHKILPKSREERIMRKPICVRGTWDAGIVDDIKPAGQGSHRYKEERFSFSRYRNKCMAKKPWDRYLDLFWNRYLNLRRDLLKGSIQYWI